jgi:hypothetical protein
MDASIIVVSASRRKAMEGSIAQDRLNQLQANKSKMLIGRVVRVRRAPVKSNAIEPMKSPT